MVMFLQCSGAHLDLHSFPTRRSSDLPRRATVGRDLRSEVTRSARRERDEGGLTVQRPGEHVELRSHRSEEHTSELQSLTNLVCRLLLEKKKKAGIYRRYFADKSIFCA